MELAVRAACAVAIIGLLLVACGGEPDPGPSGRSMSAPLAPDDSAGNRAPVVTGVTLVPEAPKPGDVIEAAVRAEDPDSDSVRLDFVWLVNGKQVPEANRPRLPTKAMKKGDRIEVRVVASDGRLESSPSVVRTRLRNREPKLQGVAFSTARVRAGDAIEAGPIASDPDGDTLRFRYRWFVNGERTDQSEAHFDTTSLERGDRVQAEVIASDGTSDTDAVRSLEVSIGNGPPRFRGVPQARQVDGAFVYAFEAEDPDGDPNLRFRLTKAPRGMRIDSKTGEARWKPDLDQEGAHPVEVIVEDNFGEGSALSFEITVNVGAEPLPAAPR